MAADRELDITIYEDIGHLAQLWKTSETKNSDIRNSVHILRRLLIYGDLQKSANSRKFELVIDAPDLSAFIKAARYELVDFYQAGGANVLGVYASNYMISNGDSHRLDRIMREHPRQVVQLNVQSFLRQQCFSFKGEAVTREDVIKYVANKAGNAHFDRKGREAVIDRIRGASKIYISQNGIPTFEFHVDAIENADFGFVPDPKNIDPVFIEVASTAKYLTESKSIKAYCEILKNEYGL